jgi:hypothetical protein
VLIAVIAVQQIEGNLLQPLIMGKALSLHPAVVLVVVTAGTLTGGIAGALVAVPLTAVVHRFLRTFYAPDSIQEDSMAGDETPERPGRSLVTTNHDVIRRWAEARGAVPATVDGTEHGDHLGVLRFDFADESANLRRVSWDEWFETFDARRLNFLFQEERTDGRQSNFFRLQSPDREDA